MTKMMSRVSMAALIAAGLAMTPALAETYKVASNDEIVIVAPYTVERDVDRSFGVGPDNERVAVSRRVSLKGLDLRYEGAVDELNRRINWTAVQVCEEAELHMRNTTTGTSDRECVRDAVRRARSEAELHIDRARG